jgi:hypothetical protein
LILTWFFSFELIMEHVVSIFYSLLDKPNKKVIKKHQIQNLTLFFIQFFMVFAKCSKRDQLYAL